MTFEYKTPEQIRLFFETIHSQNDEDSIYSTGEIIILLDDTEEYLVESNWLDPDGKLTFQYDVGDGETLNLHGVYLRDVQRVTLTDRSNFAVSLPDCRIISLLPSYD